MPDMRTNASDELRALPSVDRVIGDAQLATVRDNFPWHTIATLVREELDSARAAIARGASAPTVEQLTSKVIHLTYQFGQTGPRSVINATGVVLHTNLGRAPLSEAATQAIMQSASSYSDLELIRKANISGIAIDGNGISIKQIKSLLNAIEKLEPLKIDNNSSDHC